MSKYNILDVVLCIRGYNGRRWIRGKKGQVTDMKTFLGRIHYKVRFSANGEPWWLPASHMKMVKAGPNHDK